MKSLISEDTSSGNDENEYEMNKKKELIWYS
jgi:hypothetical protein